MTTNYYEIKNKVLLSLENKLEKSVIENEYIPKITLDRYTFMQKISLINRLIELDFFDQSKKFLDSIDIEDTELNYEQRLFIGLSYMKLGNEKGFKLYHNRVFCQGCKSCNGQYKEINNLLDVNKYWKGENIRNKTIYIIAEQGHGDFIMWIRYLLYLRNANIYLYVHGYAKKIIPLCHIILSNIASNNSLNIVDSIQNDYDYWIYMGDLTNIFNIRLNFSPKMFPYILPLNDRLEYWKKKLNSINRKIICINLCGADTTKDPRRIELSEIESLFSISDYKFININRDVVIDHPNVDYFENIDRDISYADTLAIMFLSYKTISSDTSIIHFAGAMNIDSILVLPLYAEWRWQTDNYKTIWYPSVKIIRKNKVDNLVETIKEIL